MRLITRVQIQGFRSLQTATLEDTRALTAFVGRNSTGKSNILRALNLFFNGEPEPGKRLTFSRDHFETVPRIKKKKQISITVSFSIPPNLKFRKGLTHLDKYRDSFQIRRWWELDAQRLPLDHVDFVGGSNQPIGDSESARQFLNLVFFRYIPNRTVPAELLGNESNAIADAIMIRMKGDRHATALLQAISAAAARMLERASGSFQAPGSPLDPPTVAVGDSLSEMLTMGGFKATGAHGLDVADEDWGAGHQAFFLYLLLHALDTSYGRFFGWRQATVWGVEEPESALHKDLETRLAEQFRSWVSDDASKIQVFQTTHSPTFSMASECGYYIDVDDGSTSVEHLSVPALTRAAERRGVSHWVNPVLSLPWTPVVLVEGKRDAAVLNHVASLLGNPPYYFLPLPELDSREQGGGKNSITAYIKRISDLISNRPPESPLLVLFDWDLSDVELEKAQSAYGNRGEDYVFRAEPNEANPLLGTDFHGIERFYPPQVLEAAHDAGELILGKAPGRPYSIAKSQLNPAKERLANRVLFINDVEDLYALAQVIRQVHRVLSTSEETQMRLFDSRMSEKPPR